MILYLGPSLGGSFLYWQARRSGEEAWIRSALRGAKSLYDFEHLMLLAVVASGGVLLWLGDWSLLGQNWFQKKLFLIGGLLLPVEVWDVAVVNGKLSPELRRDSLSPRVLAAHERVLTWGGALFSLAALGILWLSVVKR